MSAQQSRGQPQSDNLSVALISGLMVIIGLIAFFFLVSLILGNAELQTAVDADGGGAILLAFLQNFGILLPVIVVALSIYLVRLGVRLYQRDLTAAMWARLVLLWLTVGLGFGIVLVGVESATLGDAVINILPWLIGGGLTVFGLLWLTNNEDIFEGYETLTSRSTRVAWNLLIPTVALLIVVAMRPLEQTFIASLTNEQFAGTEETEFVGLDNYARLLGVRLDSIPCETAEGSSECLTETNEAGDTVTVYPRSRNYLIDTVDSYRSLGYRPLSEFNLFGTRYALSARDDDFIQSIGNTLLFTVIAVTLELILGLIIALVVNSKFPGRGLIRAAMIVPWAVPTVISARLWEVMLRDGRSGVVNEFLLTIGVLDTPISWLTDAAWQVPSMIAVDVWKTTPFMALLLLAGLQLIPSDVYEAADVDGASRLRQFFSITLPLLRPTIAVALVFRTLDSIRVFDVFQVLLGERAFSMATYNYNTLILGQEFGYASTIGVVIFIIILIFTVAYVRILGVEAD